MRTLNFAVKLRCPGFDIDMPYASIFYMPVELCLKFMATICSDLLKTKRKLFDDVIYKIYIILLRVPPVTLSARTRVASSIAVY